MWTIILINPSVFLYILTYPSILSVTKKRTTILGKVSLTFSFLTTEKRNNIPLSESQSDQKSISWQGFGARSCRASGTQVQTDCFSKADLDLSQTMKELTWVLWMSSVSWASDLFWKLYWSIDSDYGPSLTYSGSLRVKSRSSLCNETFWDSEWQAFLPHRKLQNIVSCLLVCFSNSAESIFN